MRTVVTAAALFCFAGTAAAVPVTYDFSGVMTNALAVDSLHFPVPDALDYRQSLGTTLTGSVTVDHGLPDEHSDPTYGAYFGAILHATVNVNGVLFDYDPAAAPADPFNYASVNNDDSTPNVGLPYNDVGLNTGDFIPTWLGDGLRASLYIDALTWDLDEITSDALPPSLDVFNNWTVFVSIYSPEHHEYGVAQTFTAVQLTRRPDPVSVVEPSSLALLGLGLLGICLTRRVARAAAE